MINSSGVKVESYWGKLFAKAVAGQNISNFFNFGGSGSSGSSAQVQAPVASEPAKTETKGKKEAPKKE